MAITTLDGVHNGLLPGIYRGKETATMLATGIFISSWYRPGYPPAATPYNPVLGSGMPGQEVNSHPSGFTFPDPVSGTTYLASVQRGYVSNPATATVSSTLLIDRMWQNSGIALNTTAAQTVDSVPWPARDQNGSRDGVGVFLGLEVSGTMGVPTPTVTVSYTNSSGAPGRTGSVTLITISAIGRFYFFSLAAGDVGVRSVQTITFSATTSGTVHLVAYRPICLLDNTSTMDVSVDEDAFSMAMPQLWNGTTIQTVSTSSGSSGGQDGDSMTMFFSQG